MSDKIIVLGGTGLLGSKIVAEAVKRGYTVIAPKHAEFDLTSEHQITIFLASNTSAVALINCVGAVHSKNYSHEKMVNLNSILPIRLAMWAERRKIPIYHISTDCVFSGRSGYNSAESNPDPVDVYGRSKLLGEINSNWVTNIRTSFIGIEGGLLAWLISQNNKTIQGWTEAYWSGTTNTQLAHEILNYIESEFKVHNNIEHFATKEGISKYVLLTLLAEALKLNIHIIPVSEPRIYRTLHPTYVLPPLKQAIEQLAYEYFGSLTSRA